MKAMLRFPVIRFMILILFFLAMVKQTFAEPPEPFNLKDGAIHFESTLVLDYSKNLHGGLDTSGDATRHLFDFNVTFDLESLLGIEESQFFLDFQTQEGKDGSELTGDIQAYSNIDEADFTAIYEAWYEQWFNEKSLRIKIGKVDTNSEFATVEHGGEFIHSSPGFSPSIFVLPTYPDPAMSVNLFFYPSDSVSFSVAVYDGAAQEGFKTGRRGPSTFFRSDPSDLFLIGESGLSWTNSRGLPGRVGIGGWFHTGTFERFDGSTDDDTGGLYLVFDQQLHQENSDDDQGIGLFAQLGWADEEVSEIAHHIDAGVAWTGMIGGRDADVNGIMASYVGLSDEAGAGFSDSYELAIETFYKIQINDHFSLKPDLQYIINPGGDQNIKDALVATIRSEVSF